MEVNWLSARRPLRRLILQEVGDALTEELLFGRLVKGGSVRIGVKGDKLTYLYEGKGRGVKEDDNGNE